MAVGGRDWNDQINREVERIANMMLHDHVSADEQDADRLGAYADRVNLEACGISVTDKRMREKAMDIVYQALLYRKMRASESRSDGRADGNILDRGSEFGAGFS